MLRYLPKMLSGISHNSYLLLLIMLFMLPIILVLCCNIKNIALTFLFECSIRVIMIQRIGVFDPMHTFLCIVNVLVKHRIELFNIVQCILYVKNREYRPNFSPLCWYNMLTYYTFYYASIIDGSLILIPIIPQIETLYNYIINHYHMYTTA